MTQNLINDELRRRNQLPEKVVVHTVRGRAGVDLYYMVDMGKVEDEWADYSAEVPHGGEWERHSIGVPEEGVWIFIGQVARSPKQLRGESDAWKAPQAEAEAAMTIGAWCELYGYIEDEDMSEDYVPIFDASMGAQCWRVLRPQGLAVTGGRHETKEEAEEWIVRRRAAERQMQRNLDERLGEKA